MNDVDETAEIVNRYYEWERLRSYLTATKILASTIISFLTFLFISYYMFAGVDKDTIIYTIIFSCIVEMISFVSSVKIHPRFFFGVSIFLGIIVGGWLRC